MITALLNVTDSRYQPELLEKAKRAGKIPLDYEIPQRYCYNTPGKSRRDSPNTGSRDYYRISRWEPTLPKRKSSSVECLKG